MNQNTKKALGAATVALLLLVFIVVGSMIQGRFFPSLQSSTTMEGAGISVDGTAATRDSAAPDTKMLSNTVAPAGTEPLVIANASVSLYVDDVAAAADKLRDVASEMGGRVSDISVSTGGGTVIPLDSASSAGSSGEIVSGWATLRVPADKLETAVSTVSKLGDVQSSSESEYDITMQHIDLVARLDNLKASETRMRELLAQSANVTEAIAVESELSRLRGEIDSLQGQLDALDDQVAMSTLSVQLTKTPSASQGTLGFNIGELLMRGVRAAVDLSSTIIIGIIAVAPLALIALVVWLIVRAIRRNKKTI